MSIIYFVRHAERDTSIKTDQEAPLTLKGKEDSESLKHFFINKDITAIYSSPYLRTISTIKPTAEKLKLPIQQIDNFHERKIGSWIDNFNQFSEHQWQDFDYKLEEGESLNEVYNRLIHSYKKIENKFTGNIIISGHGTALAILFHHLTEGNFGYKEWSDMKMPDIYQYNITIKQLKKETI